MNPYIAAFLSLLARDIEAGRNVRGLPEDLARTMLEHAGHNVVLGDDFDEDVVPGDPARDEYRQGNTMGPAYRYWRRAKIGRRYRLFFRYDSKAKVIVYAWVNDGQTLRSSGSKSDRTPYLRRCSDAGIRQTNGVHW